MKRGGVLKTLFDKIRRQVSMENIRRIVHNPYLFLSFLRSLRASIRSEKLDREKEIQEMPGRLSEILEVDEKKLEDYWGEIEELEEFYEEFDDRWEDLEDAGVLGGTAGRLDSKVIYVVCRAVEPETVVETGVRYGSFDAHILAAMEKNGKGTLYSIDLPDAVNRFEFGYLIPEDLRHRWELREGDSRKVLPELVEKLDSLEIFLHDSLHTPKHMRAEYNTVFHMLADESVLTSHDILMTDTFQKFAEQKEMEWRKVNNLGLAVKKQDFKSRGDKR